MGHANRRLILASSSPYRRSLLTQLGLTFECISPNLDETSAADETVEALTQRLAVAKAEHILLKHPESLVIGSDQAADLEGVILGKPHDTERAAAQLRACSGKTVHFYSAIALLSSRMRQIDLVCTEVRFRVLTENQIRTYIKKEEPLNCAGSFKCEGLGIALFESIQSADPSALIGLPLISLTRMLSTEEVDVLTL
jgi:septum formation protein